MGSRRKARELALQALFAFDFGHHGVDAVVRELRRLAAEPPSDDAELASLVRTDDAEAIAFAERLVRGVAEHQEAIDQLLSECSTNWKLPRMAIVDRNILRMAAFELRHIAEVPPKVTLNEAIEIAKRYGTADSSAFINGILDRVATLERASKGG